MARTILVAGALAPLDASAADIDLRGVEYQVAGADVTIREVDVAGKAAVQVAGKGTPVRLDLGRALAAKGDDAQVKSFAFGIQHVDAGTHTFEIAFGASGSTRSPLGKAQLQCNGTPLGKVKLQCDEAPLGKAKLLCDEAPLGKAMFLCDEAPQTGMGHAVIVPEFAGSSTYAIRILERGKVVRDLAGCTGATEIPNFEEIGGPSHSETLRVKLDYGIVNANAWTITMIHEDFTILITAEAKQSAAIAELSLRTTGLDTVTLVEQKLTFQGQ